MWFILKMSLRNVLRNPGRTLITSAAVVVGVMLMIFGWGLVDGLDENIIRASSQVVSGDLLMRPEGYPEDGMSYPLDKVRQPPDLSALADIGPVAERVEFQGRLVHGSDATRILGIGYDPEQDPKVFPRENWKIDGHWPTPGKSEVVLGRRLAGVLRLKIGDDVFIEARTADGAMNALTWSVVGLLDTDNVMMDLSALWLAMPDAEQLLQLQGRRSHIAVKVEHGSPESAKARLNLAGWGIKTVREEVADILELNDFRRRALGMLVVVIMAIAATGIANSVLMAAFERVREIGALRALGMRKSGVAAMFAIEGLTMGLAAGLLGAAIGCFLVLHWEKNGIVLGDNLVDSVSTMGISTQIFTKFSWVATFSALGFALFVAQVASLYPMWFATSLNPADAVRSE